MSSKAFSGSTACCGIVSALNSCLNDDAFVVLRLAAMFVSDVDGVEIRERDEERGFTPGRRGNAGPELVGRLGNGEFAPERDEGEEGVGLRSCHIFGMRDHSSHGLLAVVSGVGCTVYHKFIAEVG